MIRFLKKIIKRLPVLYPFCKWLYEETTGRFIMRFTDRRGYVRYKFRRKLRELSSLIVTEGLAGGLITEHGDFYIKAHDGLYLYYNYSDSRYTLGDGQSLDFSAGLNAVSHKVGRIEEFLLRYMRNGMVYFDVGANNGYIYSLKIARMFAGCKVYAFEPDVKILYHLRKNIAYNGLSNVKVIPQALSNFVGTTKMTAKLGASGYLIVGNSSSIDTVEVECNTLDNFVKQNNIERIDVIKVDIEGGEYDFLRGAEESIRRLKPIMFLELRNEFLERSNSSLDDVISFLSNLNYECYLVADCHDGFFIPIEKMHILHQTDYHWLKEIE